MGINYLKGKNFVFTGELDSFSRDEAKKRIKMFGGKVTGNISKNTNYIVVGKEPGSKLKKAKKLGVKVLNEKDFISTIK